MVLSGGPDGKLTGEQWCHDIVESSSSIHYFQREYAALLRALAEHYSKTGIFPQNEADLKPVLAAAHLTKEQLTDPWGHPYEFKFSTQAQYGNRTDIESFSNYSSEPIVKTQITPVTQQVAHISIWSDGPAPQQGFDVDGFSRVLSEQSSKDASAVPTSVQAPLGVGEGAISGTVIDPSGKTIPRATVVATSDAEKQYQTRTDEQGNYALSLPAGFYRIEITGEGFQERFVLKVPVQASQMTKLSTKLIYDSAALRALLINRRGLTINTEAATVSSTAEMVMVEKKRRPASANQTVFFTPRVRKNFTETLLWRPEVITDVKGNAHISFPMADNITSWKMSVMASSQDGQIGVADRESAQLSAILH